MTTYPSYSKDIWDYLGDMPYMPNREDRDRLVKAAEKDEHAKKRVQIWDYFFRIRRGDVGKPQSREIDQLSEELETSSAAFRKRSSEINSRIASLKEKVRKAKRKRILIGLIVLLAALMFIGVGIAVFLLIMEDELSLAATVASVPVCFGLPLVLFGLIALLTAKSAGKADQRTIEALERELQDLKVNHKRKVSEAKKRIAHLESEIEELKEQIPESPSDTEVREWLDEDLKALEEYSIESSGLGTRLVAIRFETDDGSAREALNPLPIRGPGELQDPDRIPRSFTAEISLDRAKHLRARRAAITSKGLEILYGVYYIEHILVADDMLATCGFFFDFITGKTTSERITEQYYKDVVAIATTKEFRTIQLGGGGDDTLNIEDAPTFSLSLASGERRTVTFVNQDYFMGIREKLGDLTEDEIRDIKAVYVAQEIADNAIKALRSYLRKHKGVSNEQ